MVMHLWKRLLQRRRKEDRGKKRSLLLEPLEVRWLMALDPFHSADPLSQISELGNANVENEAAAAGGENDDVAPPISIDIGGPQFDLNYEQYVVRGAVGSGPLITDPVYS